MLPDGICHLFCRRTVGQWNDLIQLLTNRQRLRQHKSSRRRPSRPGRPCSPALVFPAERAQARVPPKRTTPATSLGDDHQSMLGRSSAAGGIRRGGCTRFGGPRMSAFCPPCRRPWRNRAQPRRLGGTLPQEGLPPSPPTRSRRLPPAPCAHRTDGGVDATDDHPPRAAPLRPHALTPAAARAHHRPRTDDGCARAVRRRRPTPPRELALARPRREADTCGQPCGVSRRSSLLPRRRGPRLGWRPPR